MPRNLIFIVGPTAAGKTRIAVKLAKRIGGEVISCDSMQVYKGMRILSQAPTKAEQDGVKHHLVGVLPPQKECSAAYFKKNAEKAIAAVIRKGRLPILVGGSGLYVKALVDGLFPSPDADRAFRKKMEVYARRRGSIKLHRKLEKIDPESARSIHPNDIRRIVRALEVYHSTGRTMSELRHGTKGLKDIYGIEIFGLTALSRKRLYSAIGERAERMFDSGVVAEIRRLGSKRLSRTAKAMLGYKEIKAYLEGEYDLGTAKEMVKRSTRRFAKRQLAWFRADKRVRWFRAGRLSDEEIVGKIIKKARG